MTRNMAKLLPKHQRNQTMDHLIQKVKENNKPNQMGNGQKVPTHLKVFHSQSQNKIRKNPKKDLTSQNHVEGDEIIIEDLTKAHLINTVPASENPELILPKFKPPIPNGGVGCKVQRHYFNWTLITQDKMAMEVITNGYLPKFKEPPPLVQ